MTVSAPKKQSKTLVTAPSTSLEEIIRGYETFRQKYQAGEDQGLAHLKSAQSPRLMIITCCDSRIKLQTLFNTRPGDVFVVRNVANVVPRREVDGATHGVSAALEYGVKILGIAHIIILGHSNCGGIRAFHQGLNNTEYLHQWISHLKEIHTRLNFQDLNRSGEETALQILAQENIRLGWDRLLTFPWIAERVQKHELTLHGWYFDLDQGQILALQQDQTFQPLGRNQALCTHRDS